MVLIRQKAHSDICTGEKARISAAGGFVDFGRVNGNLALSRAIGDFEFKKSADLSPEQQIVTAFPDVITHEVSSDDEFLVIACDGKVNQSMRFGSYLSSTCRYLGLSVIASRY
jgi:serine/threonine protein phosphatase PrpC